MWRGEVYEVTVLFKSGNAAIRTVAAVPLADEDGDIRELPTTTVAPLSELEMVPFAASKP